MLPRYRWLGAVQDPALLAGRIGKTPLSIKTGDLYSSPPPRAVLASRNSLRIKLESARGGRLSVAVGAKWGRRPAKSSRSTPSPAGKNGNITHRLAAPIIITAACYQRMGDWCLGHRERSSSLWMLTPGERSGVCHLVGPPNPRRYRSRSMDDS